MGAVALAVGDQAVRRGEHGFHHELLLGHRPGLDQEVADDAEQELGALDPASGIEQAPAGVAGHALEVQAEQGGEMDDQPVERVGVVVEVLVRRRCVLDPFAGNAFDDPPGVGRPQVADGVGGVAE